MVPRVLNRDGEWVDPPDVPPRTPRRQLHRGGNHPPPRQRLSRTQRFLVSVVVGATLLALGCGLLYERA
jgi:hypothetical protein